MATVSREIVMEAIFAKINAMTFGSQINGASTWLYTSRRLKLWNAVDPTQQPACFLVTHQETDEYRGLGLERRRLNLMCWCYSRSGDANAVPPNLGQTDLDTMMESFEQAFGPAAVDNFSTNQCTLGGLVYFVRIEGKVFKDPGDIDGQTLLLVPLLVEFP
jgi:hypothetical protein